MNTPNFHSTGSFAGGVTTRKCVSAQTSSAAVAKPGSSRAIPTHSNQKANPLISLKRRVAGVATVATFQPFSRVLVCIPGSLEIVLPENGIGQKVATVASVATEIAVLSTR
jgi:hypothetical protein